MQIGCALILQFLFCSVVGGGAVFYAVLQVEQNPHILPIVHI